MKAFSQDSFNDNDARARQVILKFINDTKFYNAIEHPDKYDVDLIAPALGVGFELEIRSQWGDGNYPYNIVNVPERKQRLFDGSHELKNYYVILNKDCTQFISISPDKLVNFIIPENLHPIPCRTNCGIILDAMYKIPLTEFKSTKISPDVFLN